MATIFLDRMVTLAPGARRPCHERGLDRTVPWPPWRGLSRRFACIWPKLTSKLGGRRKGESARSLDLRCCAARRCIPGCCSPAVQLQSSFGRAARPEAWPAWYQRAWVVLVLVLELGHP